MASGQLGSVVEYLRKIAASDDVGGTPDAQLLERFVRQRDELAYEALMRRHGPMVLGICGRILRDAHDAEDAFQATFLVFARKAPSINQRRSLGGWLYRIAFRTATKARAKSARRRGHEKALRDSARAGSAPASSWDDLRPLLDEELNRLPDKYRTAIVLCYLQEMTYAEAARVLGLAAGTISSRLSKARDLLRGRLSRRGLALSAGALATVFSENASTAAMPGAVMNATTGTAVQFAAGNGLSGGLISVRVATLTESVLRAMFISSLRTAAAALLTVAFICGGVAALTHRNLGQQQAGMQQQDPTQRPPSDEARKPPGERKNPREKPDANAYGYVWFCKPTEVTLGSLLIGNGVAYVTEEDKNGALVVTLARASDRDMNTSEFRPVAFDADGTRYLPGCGMCGAGKSSLAMCRYELDLQSAPASRIQRVGIEVLAPDGRRKIAARAMERARAARVEVLSPAQLGEPYDFTLTLMDGKKLRAHDLLGKVVLIDCWSTTCSPCMKKMPTLKRLYEKYHKDGFEIIGVSFDTDAATTREACRQYCLLWPQAFVPSDDKTRELWEQAAGLKSVPLLLLMDRDGIFRADCHPDHLGEAISKLMEPLAEKLGPP
jgi:RNA polymerase sigma factor (sigma-70 family)